MIIKHVLSIDFHNVVRIFLTKLSETKFDLIESNWVIKTIGSVELASLIYDVYADNFTRLFDRSRIPECIEAYLSPQLPDDKWEIMTAFQSYQESIDKRALFFDWGEDVVKIATDNSVVDMIFEQFSNCLCWAIDDIIHNRKRNTLFENEELRIYRRINPYLYLCHVSPEQSDAYPSIESISEDFPF